MKKIIVGLIGYGYWGPNLARNIVANESYELAWVADVMPKNLAVVSRLYPTIKTTEHYQDILSDDTVDLVVIATPIETHYLLAKESLEANKHVLVEKPLTDSVENANELVDLAASKGKVLAVDHVYLYSTAVRKLKELIDSGQLGELCYIDSERINLGLVQKHHNVLWDLAVHDLYIMDYLLGKAIPLEIVARAGNFTQGKQEEFGTVMLKYPGNVIAMVTTSWLSPVKMRRMIITGTAKMVLYDDVSVDEKIRIYDKGVEYNAASETPFSPIYRSGDIVVPRLEVREALALELDELRNAIIDGKPTVAMGADGARIVSILCQANVALKN
jgi:predicted dehydrogenase